MKSKKMEDLIGRLQELHPDTDIKLLKSIVKQGFKEMNKALIRNREVNLQALRKNVKMTIFVPCKNPIKTRASYKKRDERKTESNE